MTSKKRRQSLYRLSHDLINKMSVIVGNCDLLIEKHEVGDELTRRITLIRDSAERAAKELAEYQSSVSRTLRKTG